MLGALATALIAGCTADGEPCATGVPHLAVVTTDYQSGILAAVDPNTGATCDRLVTVGPDPAVRSWPGEAAVFDRTGGTSLRLYDTHGYGLPAIEIALEPGLNVHDVVPVGDELWLAPYEEPAVWRLSRSGEVLGTVDLAAHADADGLPEIDRFVPTGDGLYVGLQRLDRQAGWAPRGGRVVRLDGDEWWEVGPNPKVYAHPGDPSSVVVLSGAFFTPDGALEVVGPGGARRVVVDEATLGYDLGGFAGVGDAGVILGVDFDVNGPSRIDCVDLATGAVTAGRTDEGWFVDAVAGGDRVYVASRTGWAGTRRDEVLVVTPETCDISVLSSEFTLDPFGLAFVGP